MRVQICGAYSPAETGCVAYRTRAFCAVANKALPKALIAAQRLARTCALARWTWMRHPFPRHQGFRNLADTSHLETSDHVVVAGPVGQEDDREVGHVRLSFQPAVGFEAVQPGIRVSIRTMNARNRLAVAAHHHKNGKTVGF